MHYRFRRLNQAPEHSGSCVIYHMSRDQRVRDNHALLSAQKYALKRELPLLVVFNLVTQSTIRLMQHYRFLITGLQEVEQDLQKLHIGFLLTTGNPVEAIQQVSEERNASAVFLDFSPLREAVETRNRIAQALTIPVYEVDTNNVVPLWIASDKEEYSAKTIRGKIHRHLAEFLKEPAKVDSHHPAWPEPFPNNWENALKAIAAEEPPFYQPTFVPGEKAAHKVLQQFIAKRLAQYATDRNKPDKNGLSNLSPYFHYGQLSVLRVNLEIKKAIDQLNTKEARESGEAFLEESIVRRELAQNFCYYNKNYTSIEAARDWARKTLEAHINDPRDWEYSVERLEKADTHDKAWNASQRQMMRTGKMHGYMRMYWAKKILEWSKTPQDAIDKAVYLNDKYELDGYEANGYVGILWAIAGIHDRPWFERPIYGSIRYMNDNGLKRKFDIDAYVLQWSDPIKL